jgi:hypothetical protein
VADSGGVTTLDSAGGTSIVTDGTGPSLEIKGLTGGSGITLDTTTDANAVIIVATGGGGTTASVTTMDATQTLLQSVSLSTASRVYSIKNTVTARSGATPIGASFIIESTFKRGAGTTVTIIGLVPFSREAKDVAAADWVVDLVTAASAVNVMVTGVLATTIEWNITTEVQQSD